MFGELDFFEMILRATLSFLVLLLMTRLMGRKQLSQLTFFNYITGIALGSIAGDIASESKTPFLNGLVSLIWWSLLTILTAYIGMKSRRARTVIDGQPVIVIKKGEILENELKKAQINMDDLTMLLREQQVFSVKDVENAIFEPNGQLSIMLKEDVQPVTKKDQKIFTIQPMYIPMELVVEGEIIEKNLKEAGITSNWLKSQLKSQNLQLSEIFYVELQKDGSLFIDKYQELTN
ncbi:DUF421 domain-containing protein [Cerasibacillus terrae]|uniref:DUF421 domain-containing protein n=1 Tax=Cerasibacillus terrae TaxID=2498845 RepID=A0A5C8NX15_9BACI|nr:DUF421 domain-containing protein [Cerasibacillus terrae]TXL65640.1 DUF421 domain-containing protein [Cerasibacillus terrae]